MQSNTISPRTDVAIAAPNSKRLIIHARAFSITPSYGSNSLLNPYICFVAEQTPDCKLDIEVFKYKINKAFVGDVLYVYLPTINYESHNNIRGEYDPKFTLSLSYLLKSMHPNYKYDLDFNLYIYTNETRNILDSDVSSLEEDRDHLLDYHYNMIKSILGRYKYNGFTSLYR